MPKLLFFVYEPLFLQNGFLEHYDTFLRNSLCKVTNVKFDDNQFLQAVLPAAKDGLGVSSARLLALPAFLASAVGAKKALLEENLAKNVSLSLHNSFCRNRESKVTVCRIRQKTRRAKGMDAGLRTAEGMEGDSDQFR